MSLVSIIIPVHNRTKELKRAVNSVLQQTIDSFEILISNDGSDTPTTALIEQLAHNDQRIKVIHLKENHGVSYARNRAIENARSEYIALLDSDDSWQPTKLAKQLNFFQEHPHADICHTDEIWIRNGVRVNPMKKHQKPSGKIFIHCLPLCAVSPSSVLIRKKVFEKEGLFDEDLPACEDYDLWLRLSMKYEFHLISEQLVLKYGGHQDQLSRRFWGMDRFRIIALLKIIDNNILTKTEQDAIKKMIQKKASILATGFKKRGKSFQHTIYAQLAEEYTQ